MYLASKSFLRFHSSEANRNHPFASQHISVHQSPEITTNPAMALLSTLMGVCLLRISSAQIGPGGQTCGIDDASSECPIDSSGFSSYTDSSIECDADYDCCYCGTILCEDCETFKIDGDYGIAEVPDITIEGKSDSGVKIECTGMLYLCLSIKPISP